MELALNDLLKKLEAIAVKYNIASVECFRRLPTKKQLPGYYEVIKHPMDLVTIEKKIRQNKYKSSNELFSDVELMSKNAFIFNDPSSLLYESGDKFYKYLTKNRKRLVSNMKAFVEKSVDSRATSAEAELVKPTAQQTEETGSLVSASRTKTRKRKSNSKPVSEIKNQLQSLMDNVINYNPNTNGDVNVEIASAVSFYFDNVTAAIKKRATLGAEDETKNPKSLSEIRENIETDKITSVDGLVADLVRLFETAMADHKSTSNIHKGALMLKNYIKQLGSGKSETYAETSTYNSLSQFISPKRRTIRTATNRLTSSFDVQTLLQSNRPRIKNKPPKHTSLDQPDGQRICFKRSSLAYKELYSKMNDVYKSLRELKVTADDDSVHVCYDFIFCPSPYTNPEYYDAIEHPIDMSTIFKRLKLYKYSNYEQFLGDFKLLFSNIKRLTLKDDLMLRNVLKVEKKLLEKSQLKTLKHIAFGTDKFQEREPIELLPEIRSQLSENISERQALKSLLAFVTEIADVKGKLLLPSLHLDKIIADIEKNRKNTTVYDAFNEINSFLESYCLKHPTDVHFYEDAILFHDQLYRFAKPYFAKMTPKMEPLIKLYDIITAVWNNVLLHKDSTGHVYHYSLSYYRVEKPVNKPYETFNRTITFDMISFCVTNNVYTNFETFQYDFIDLCSHVRSATNIYSEPHRDAVELLVHFVDVRDKVIDGLDTNALEFNSAVLNSQLETDSFKYPSEQRINFIDRYLVVDTERLYLCKNYENFDELELDEDHHDSVTINFITIQKGDGVRIRESDDDWLLLGFFGDLNENKYCVVARLENYDVLPRKYTRTYLEDEMIVTDYLMIYRVDEIDQVIERVCYTHHYKPQLHHNGNVSMFDHFYSYELDEYFFVHQFFVTRPKHMIDDSSHFPNLQLNRGITLEATSQRSTSSNNTYDVSILKSILAVNNNRVVKDITTGVMGDDGLVHYLQIACNGSFYRKNDYVYLYDKEDELTVGRIADLWKDKQGQFMFKATILYFPEDLKHNPVRMFYPNEVFKTNAEVTQNVDCIYSRCCVTHPSYYYSNYPVICDGSEVFLCESSYNPQTNHIRKNKPHKNSFHSHPHMIYDERISLVSENCDRIHKVPSPFLVKEVIKINDKRSRSSNVAENTPTGSAASKKQHRSKHSKVPPISADATTADDLNVERAATREPLNSTAYQSPLKPAPYVGVCQWKNCDSRFRSTDQILDHVLSAHGPSSHTSTIEHTQDTGGNDGSAYKCYWSDCSHQSNGSKFQYLHQLIQHIKDNHIMMLDESNANNTNQTRDSSLNRNASSNHQQPTTTTTMNDASFMSVTLDQSKLNDRSINGNLNDTITSVLQAHANNDRSTENFYRQLFTLKNLIPPFLNTVTDHVSELKTEITQMNCRISKLNETVVEQREKIQKLEESHQSRCCCYAHNDPQSNSCTLVELDVPINNASVANGSVDSSHHDDTAQVRIMTHPDFLQSASADLLRYAVQQQQSHTPSKPEQSPQNQSSSQSKSLPNSSA